MFHTLRTWKGLSRPNSFCGIQLLDSLERVDLSIYKVNPFATVTTSLHARADLKLTRKQVYKSPHRNTMATSDMSDKEDHPKNEESGKPYPTSTGLGFGNAAAVPSDEDIVY